MSNGDIAVLIINWSFMAQSEFFYELSDIGLTESMIARDLYKHEDIGEVIGKFKVSLLPSYGSVVLRFRKTKDVSNIKKVIL